LNLRTLKKAILIPLLFIVGVFLVRTYLTEIVTILGESWRIFHENQIHYLSLAFLVHLMSIYLFAIHCQQVLSVIVYDLEATCLFPTFFGKIIVNNLTLASMAGGEMLLILWVNKRFGISYTNAFRSILSERSIEAISILILLIYASYSLSPLEIKLLPLRSSPTLSSNDLLILVFFITGMTILFLRAIFTYCLNCVQLNWRRLKKLFTFTPLLSFGDWIFDKIHLKMMVLALKIDLSLHLVSTISILYLLLISLSIVPNGLGIFEGGIIYVRLYLGLTLALVNNFCFLECFELLWAQQHKRLLHLINYGGFKVWKSSKLH
jgi:uncharacterized membrane protein YbhN (UPF0104 family)